MHEVGARIARKDRLMKDAIHAQASALAKKENVDEEYAKLCEEMKALQAKNQSLVEESQKFQAEIQKLKESENEANVELTQSQLDYSNLLEEFEQFKSESAEKEDAAYNEGMEKAENDLAQQIPQLQDAFFNKGWQAALTAAGVDPSSELFTRHSAPSSSQPPAPLGS